MLNPEMDKCLMVQGMGKNSGWGFPKGKVGGATRTRPCLSNPAMPRAVVVLTPSVQRVSGALGTQPAKLSSEHPTFNTHPACCRLPHLDPQMNKDEPDAECAVREVLEEVGLDIAGIVDETAFVETERTGQRTKLFIVRGVPESVRGRATPYHTVTCSAPHLLPSSPCHFVLRNTSQSRKATEQPET